MKRNECIYYSSLSRIQKYFIIQEEETFGPLTSILQNVQTLADRRQTLKRERRNERRADDKKCEMYKLVGIRNLRISHIIFLDMTKGTNNLMERSLL